MKQFTFTTQRQITLLLPKGIQVKEQVKPEGQVKYYVTIRLGKARRRFNAKTLPKIDRDLLKAHKILQEFLEGKVPHPNHAAPRVSWLQLIAFNIDLLEKSLADNTSPVATPTPNLRVAEDCDNTHTPVEDVECDV